VNKAIIIGIIIAFGIGIAVVSIQTTEQDEIVNVDEFVDDSPKRYSISLSESLDVTANP
jgi:hypothetical protein